MSAGSSLSFSCSHRLDVEVSSAGRCHFVDGAAEHVREDADWHVHRQLLTSPIRPSRVQTMVLTVYENDLQRRRQRDASSPFFLVVTQGGTPVTNTSYESEHSRTESLSKSIKLEISTSALSQRLEQNIQKCNWLLVLLLTTGHSHAVLFSRC